MKKPMPMTEVRHRFRASRKTRGVLSGTMWLEHEFSTELADELLLGNREVEQLVLNDIRNALRAAREGKRRVSV